MFDFRLDFSNSMMLVNTQNRMSGVIMVTFILMLIENFKNTFFDESVKQIEF